MHATMLEPTPQDAHVYPCGHFHTHRIAAAGCRLRDWETTVNRLRLNIAEGRTINAAASARVLFRRARRAGLFPGGAQ
jgi:hypothetical protein